MSGGALSVRKALSQPSPSDWERWEERLLAGEEPSTAATACCADGHLTCSAFKRDNPGRHAEALAMSREARGYVTDKLVEKDVCVRDKEGVPVRFKPKASDAMKQFYARRWQPAFAVATTQLEVSGPGGGPVELAEGFSPTTVLDVIALAGEIGVLAQLGYEKANVIEQEAVEVSDEAAA